MGKLTNNFVSFKQIGNLAKMDIGTPIVVKGSDARGTLTNISSVIIQIVFRGILPHITLIFIGETHFESIQHNTLVVIPHHRGAVGYA